jgi:predicted RNA-binding Zn-ribbon protein involved in translation (DUF1610 family)
MIRDSKNQNNANYTALPDKPTAPNKPVQGFNIANYYCDDYRKYFEPYSSVCYIQNNNAIIEKTLNVHNPDFRSASFLNWAVIILRSIAENGIERNQSVTTKKFKTDSGDILDIKRESIVNMCYLNLYKEGEGIESLVVCLALADKPAETIVEINNLPKYFAVFQRKSQLRNMTDGKAEIVRCPNCGGDLALDNLSRCPYCGQTISRTENDWHLDEFYKVRNNTLVANIGVIIKR